MNRIIKTPIILLSLFCLISMGACDDKTPQHPDSESSISGYIDNIPGAQLVLAKQSTEGIIPIDTTWVEEDGYFVFTSPINEISVYRVIIDPKNYLTIAAKKGDHITLEADGLALYNNYFVSGSKESELIKIVVENAMGLSRKMDSIKTDINHQKSAKDTDGLIRSFDMQKELHDTYHDFSVDFIHTHPGSIAAYFVVIGLQTVDNPDEYIMVSKELSISHPAFEFLPILKQKADLLSTISVNSHAPELNFPNPEGTSVSLSSLRGKYVLIDFWASWCKPCRMENPNVVRLYNRYKDQGFEIYGYSLDESRNDWIAAIAQDKLTWIHTSDLKGWKAAGAATYGVQSIPTTYLIDPDGVIIGKNLRGKALEEKLAEIF